MIRKTWDEAYLLLKEYYDVHHNIKLKHYYCVDGYNLGGFLYHQKDLYRKNLLALDKITKLEALDINWTIKKIADNWFNEYKKLEQLAYLIKNINVEETLVYQDFKVGRWLLKQIDNLEVHHLSNVKKALLLDLGFTFKKVKSKTSFKAMTFRYYLEAYYPDIITNFSYEDLKLDLYIPSLNLGINLDYKDKNKYKKDDLLAKKLGIRVIRIRNYYLEKTNYAKSYLIHLDDNLEFSNIVKKVLKEDFGIKTKVNLNKDFLGIYRLVDLVDNSKWYQELSVARKYYEKEGNLLVSKENQALFKWLKVQRTNYANKLLSRWQIKALEDIGMIFDVKRANFLLYYKALCKYYSLNGHLDVKLDEVMDGLKIGTFVDNKRRLYRNNLDETIEEVRLLNEIGMIWDYSDFVFETKFEIAKQYYLEYGNLNVSSNFYYEGMNLGNWLSNLRTKLVNPTNDKERSRKELLTSIGMKW